MIKVTAESRRRYGKQKFCSGKRWNLSSIDGASLWISLQLPKANSNSLQDHGVKVNTKETRDFNKSKQIKMKAFIKDNFVKNMIFNRTTKIFENLLIDRMHQLIVFTSSEIADDTPNVGTYDCIRSIEKESF